MPQFFVAGMQGGSTSYEVDSFDITVGEVHKLVGERLGIKPEQLRLLFAGKQLDFSSKPHIELKEYGVQNGSTLHAVLRLPGGSKVNVVVQSYNDQTSKKEFDLEPESSVRQLFVEAGKLCSMTTDHLRLVCESETVQREWTVKDLKALSNKVPLVVYFEKGYSQADWGIKFTDAPDVITADADPSVKRSVMSCGHAVEPNSLTAYIRSLVDAGKCAFTCPAKLRDGHPPVLCAKEWDYISVRQHALLNDAECAVIETRWGQAAAVAWMDAKEHSECRCWVMRENHRNNRVVCIMCTKAKKRTFEFCWVCGREWKGSGTTECGNADCVHPEFPAVRDSDMKKFTGSNTSIPLRRACITCGKVLEHQDGCKYVTCPRCVTTFCFNCLKTQTECHPTSIGYFDGCSAGAAPKQSKLPVWMDALAGSAV